MCMSKTNKLQLPLVTILVILNLIVTLLLGIILDSLYMLAIAFPILGIIFLSTKLWNIISSMRTSSEINMHDGLSSIKNTVTTGVESSSTSLDEKNGNVS